MWRCASGAESSNLILDAAEFNRRWKEQGEKGGQEHDVYFDEPTQLWWKRNTLHSTHGSWLEYFNRVMLHNHLFPEAPMRLVGFVRTGELTPEAKALAQSSPSMAKIIAARSMLLPVVSQPHIKKHPTRKLTDADTIDFMEKIGFKPIPNSNYDFIHREAGIIVQDLHDANAFFDTSGEVVVIDDISVMDSASKTDRLWQMLDTEAELQTPAG